MDFSKNFKATTVDIGVVDPQSVNEIKWEITDIGSLPKIIHFAADCGCTAEIEQKGNFVIAKFTESDSININPSVIEDWYPSGKMQIIKNIYAYLKDDKDLFIIDESQSQALNPNKAKITLTFKGAVNLTSLVPPKESN